MDLNKLRTFTVVAQHQSISRAAETLYRTQPAISNQLKALESELGLKLFERKHARVFLTREGASLYEHATRHIGALDDAALRLRADRKSTEGHLRILVESDTVDHLLPGLVREFSDEFPNVRLEILPSTYALIDERLINNEADFAFMVLYTRKSFFRTHPFYTFTRRLAAAASLIEERPIVGVEVLAALKHIGFISTLGDLRFWLKKNDLAHHISTLDQQLRSVIVHDASTLNDMVIQGVGSGFVFDSTIDPALFDSGELVQLFPELELGRVTVDLAYRKARNESFVQQSFREFLLDYRQRLM